METIKTLYIIHAMKRSGHHAILNWLCYKFGEITYFDKIKNVPILSWDCNLVHHYLNGDCCYYELGQGINYLDAANYMISLENNKLIPYQHEQLEIKYILVVRDPYNWIASCLNTPASALNMRENIEIWKQHIREAFGETKIIPGILKLSYNKWFVDKEYRKMICEKAGLPFNDRGLNEVFYPTGKSSFDDIKYRGRAQRLDVLNRYKTMLNNKEYRGFVDDRELQELAKHFDMTPDILEIAENVKG